MTISSVNLHTEGIGGILMPEVIPLKNKMKNAFSVNAKAGDPTVGEIYIYAEIGESWWSASITDEQFIQELDKVKDVNTLNIYFNSPGGDVFHGWAIFNAIKRHKATKKSAYIDGIAASIASVIMLACDEVIMGEGAQIMIHRAASGCYGFATDQENLAQRLHVVDAQLITTYMDKTKKAGKAKDRTTVEGKVVAETWFTADQAIEFGIADKKSDQKAVAIAASSLSRPWINQAKVPKSVFTDKTQAKAEIQKMSKNIKDVLAR